MVNKEEIMAFREEINGFVLSFFQAIIADHKRILKGQKFVHPHIDMRESIIKYSLKKNLIRRPVIKGEFQEIFLY